MSDEVEYWRMKYALLEHQFLQQKKRNEELEDKLLSMIDKVENDKKQLANEIDLLNRKLETITLGQFSNRLGKDAASEIDEPEDPLITCHDRNPVFDSSPSQRSFGGVLIEGRNHNDTHQEKGYHHFPVLAYDEGIIYGFRWQKGNVVKLV